MPSVFSCHNEAILINSQNCKIVPHIAQRFHWDCGVASIAMMVAYLLPKHFPGTTAYRTVVEVLSAMFPEYSREEMESRGLPGLWTIHLCLVLKKVLEGTGNVSTHPSLAGPQVCDGSSTLIRENSGGTCVELLPLTGAKVATLNADPISISESMQVSFFTTCLGPNPSHKDLPYYAQHFTEEAQGVSEAFKQATEFGIQVQCTALGTRDIVELITEENGDIEILFVCLVDAAKLRCSCRSNENAPATWSEAAWSWVGYTPSRPYCGHYVTVVGYDKDTDMVLYRNPCNPEADGEGCEGTGWLCAEYVSTFEMARASPGTDYDTIMVRIC